MTLKFALGITYTSHAHPNNFHVIAQSRAKYSQISHNQTLVANTFPHVYAPGRDPGFDPLLRRTTSKKFSTRAAYKHTIIVDRW